MNKTACASVSVFIGARLSLILAIIAIAIPYWEYVQFHETSSYYGLWRGCMADHQYDICHSLDYVSTSMLVVRFLEILGVILLSFALLSRVVAHSDYLIRNSEDTFVWDGILTIISGVLMVAGTFVYWWITQEEMGEYSDHFGLDASFAICVIAGASSLATGFLRILIERKRKFSRYGSRMAKRQQSIRRTVCGNTSATNIALVLLSQQAEIDRQRSLPKIPPGTNGSHIDTLTKHSVVPNVHCY